MSWLSEVEHKPMSFMSMKPVPHYQYIHWGTTLRDESNQTNAILQYKLLAAILSAVCSVIQQS